MGFADDTALEKTAKLETILNAKATNALAKIGKAIKERRLRLATKTTDAIISYGRRKLKNIGLKLNQSMDE